MEGLRLNTFLYVQPTTKHDVMGGRKPENP